ncbi:MAG: SAM-dependent methyltransferase [Micrococcales bacterium]|nr:MAG: SAM-dependent methyltransferase [Micrococcales bacterium]PIE27182.1 MAG: SAM-dependent methyltransferase [Micrococcales bacterium]
MAVRSNTEQLSRDDRPVHRVLHAVTTDRLPFRVLGYDGTDIGPRDAPLTLKLVDRRALQYLTTAPGELGLSRAYLSGAIDVEGVHPGNPYPALATLKQARLKRPSPVHAARLMRDLGVGMFKRPPLPPREAPPRWLRAAQTRLPAGARRRVEESIGFHYDVGNPFYEIVLGPTMTYSCGVFTPEDPSLDAAQERKHALIADKLDLQPGQRLLDIGCGWGGMVRHAARHRRVRAVGVTVSRQQADWARAKVEEEGLSDLVQIRHQDYRDVPETGFDAICSIGMAEHVGVRNLPGYFEFIRDRLRVGGRLLNHCITRVHSWDRPGTDAFIDRYVFPNGELTTASRLTTLVDDCGLEVHHVENLRMHYARTLAAWSTNLQENWDAAVAAADEQIARVWGLYMAGARLSFEDNTLHVAQMLATKPAKTGETAYPLRSHW